MTLHNLIRRSLRYHWRSHLGVVLGAAIGSAALIGALVVGDSVQESLRDHALERLGNIHIAMTPGDRFFKEGLGWRLPGGFRDAWREDDIFTYFPDYPAAALQLPGVVAMQSGTARANHVNVIGALQDEELRTSNAYTELWSFTKTGEDFDIIKPGEVWLNQALALQLGATVGDAVVLRVRKAGALASETPLSPKSDNTAVLRLRMAGIIPANELGNFALQRSIVAPLNAFVNLRDLQFATGLTNRINTLVGWGVLQTVDSLPEWLQRFIPQKIADRFEHNRAKSDTESASIENEELGYRLTLDDLQA